MNNQIWSCTDISGTPTTTYLIIYIAVLQKASLGVVRVVDMTAHERRMMVVYIRCSPMQSVIPFGSDDFAEIAVSKPRQHKLLGGRALRDACCTRSTQRAHPEADGHVADAS